MENTLTKSSKKPDEIAHDALVKSVIEDGEKVELNLTDEEIQTVSDSSGIPIEEEEDDEQ